MNQAVIDQGHRLLDAMSEDSAIARDATRYRWLRERDLDTIDQGGVFVGLTPHNLLLNGVELDVVVDSAIATSTSGLWFVG